MQSSARVRTVVRPYYRGSRFFQLNHFLKTVAVEEPAIIVSFFFGGVGLFLTLLAVPKIKAYISPYKTPQQGWVGESW